MNDWNGNGKQDSSDKFVDYTLSNANQNRTANGSKHVLWWIGGGIVLSVLCPPVGILLLLFLILYG